MTTIFSLAGKINKLTGAKLDHVGLIYGVERKRKFLFFKEDDNRLRIRIIASTLPKRR